ncbi:MAG: Xaa-Pro peptidase family protein [Muribaculaceae bacterium]|nr:Xaa-Pro peptidase family protein [Muribaculaceae bacterium]
MNTEINLLGDKEQSLRTARLHSLMRQAGIDRALIRDNAAIYWLTGRVFRGFIYIDLALDAPLYFVRQPNHLHDSRPGAVHLIRKPEEIASLLAAANVPVGCPVALELDSDTYGEAVRLAAVFGQTPGLNISPVVRRARAVKTAREQEMLRASGVKQSLVYERIPHLYREGMSDIELQIEIERASRLEGCLGQFRVSGADMELFMGNVLTGENGDTPSPYDFAMGGEGLDPSIPVGANGSLIRPGAPVMVDVNGNYNGYMTDMTRMYSAETVDQRAEKLNQLSADICTALAAMMAPGVEAKALYEKALAMATEAGYADYFMGHRHHAGFVGHGVGIEVNELPVLAPRSRDILEEGNVIAVEPKFVVPGLGAVGVENTYIVGTGAPAECITTARTTITLLD